MSTGLTGNYGVGMAGSTTSGRTTWMNDTLPSGSKYFLWWYMAGSLDTPFAWQGCMVKLSN